MEDRATRSLNLSTTVGIAVYEVLCQRRSQGASALTLDLSHPSLLS